MKKSIISSIILSLILKAGAADAQSGKNLALKDAVRLALENNNTYKISIEQVEESSLRVRETWGMLWPSFSTDAAYTRQWAESGMNSMIEGIYNITFINAEIAVNPGAFYNSLQASRNGHIISVNNVKTVKADTIIKTIQLYYQMILTKETIRMREQSLKALEENLRVVTVGYEKGVISKLDLLRARVASANEKTLLINSENDYLASRAAINIQIGNEIDVPVEAGFTNIADPDSEVSQLKTDESERGELENIIKTALKNRPELIQLTKKKEAEDYAAGAAESIYLWPTFFLNGKYGTTKTIQKEGTASTGDPAADAMMQGLSESLSPPEWTNSWSITVGAAYKWGSWCPLDSANAKAKQGKSKAKQTEYQMDDFIKSVRLEVQSGFLKLKSALNSIKAQQGNIDAANETLKVSIEQFRSGIIDNTKLLEANAGLTTAQTLYIQALYNYQTAKAELNKAIGAEYFKIE